jgi:hypothetical protein
VRRGDALQVQATSTDEYKDIKEVNFYIGKPGPDGNPPPMAIKVKGVWNAENKLWFASLAAPTDQKGKVDVSAQFVKLTNVSDTGTVTVELKDASNTTAPGVGKGSIAGTVVEGSLGQPGLDVRLVDDKGAVKDSTKTDAKGKYEFKDVPVGTYKVTAAKTTDSTKGETGVEVVDAQVKTVDVKLWR